MASPNWDAISVRHAMNISDPAAGAVATGNGLRWTSAQRDSHINAAVRRWMLKHVSAGKKKEEQGLDASINWEALSGYLNEEAQSLVANVKTLASWTGGVAHIIGAYDTTTSVPIKSFTGRNRFFTGTGGNQYLLAGLANLFYVLDAASIRVIGSAATDSITLRYVKQHTDLSANGASDIVVPSAFWHQIQDLAFKVAAEETGEADKLQVAALKEQVIDKEIGLV